MGQILVKSPVTSNGSNPLLDSNGQIIYKETILEDKAAPILEKINEKLPQHLRKTITKYNGKTETKTEVKTETVESKKSNKVSDDKK